MEPFTILHGVVAPLDRVNVDTDQIIPKQFLKRIERTGYGEFLFYDWRFDKEGLANPNFVLNQGSYSSSSILVSGRNFGCGSSREHAPWALLDFGLRCVIAPSFADIFSNNCFQNGLLPVALPEGDVKAIIAKAQTVPGYKVLVDLKEQHVYDENGDIDLHFEIEPFRRHCLLNGLDDIGLTLEHEAKIAVFEQHRSAHGGVLTKR